VNPRAMVVRAGDELARARLALELMVERRWLAVVLADVVLLGLVLLTVLTGSAESRDIYNNVVVLPLLLLGVPVLANGVAVERRSGSLELLLASPIALQTFLRRYLSFCGLLTLQGWIVVGLLWFVPSRSFPLPFVMLQILLVTCMVGSVSMLWGVYLRSAGAVIAASLLTLLLLSPWLFQNPIPVPDEPTGSWFPSWSRLFEWLRTNAVLATATVICFLYTRRRLKRSEKVLS